MSAARCSASQASSIAAFASSPASNKAQLVQATLQARGQGERFFCPALSPVPVEAIAQASAIIARQPDLTLVGSSLGGFYATWLAEKYGLNAALINPAVVAPISLARYIGVQRNFYSGECFEFTAAHVEQLRALDVAKITPERYLLLVETGDEVLDYRYAVERYAGCRQIVLQGGDHSFTRLPEVLPQLLEFCRL